MDGSGSAYGRCHATLEQWNDIELRERKSTETISVRVLRVAGSHPEKLAILELKTPFAGVSTLPLRMEPLIAEERIASLAYPGSQLRFANGRFVKYGDDTFAGAALFEMYDGNDRLVLDHGASVAPVLDCESRIVAVVSITITQTINFLAFAVRTSTAWQTPNVVSIPDQVLKDFTRLN